MSQWLMVWFAEKSQQVSPAVAQAHVKLKQAMNVASSKPSRAAGALWALAQGILKLQVSILKVGIS
jgi:uncharacterized membrane protein